MGLLDALAGFATKSNPVLGALGTGLNLLSLAKSSQQRNQLSKKAIKKLNQKAPTLEIPHAFQQLLAGLNDQAMQLGATRRTEINKSFNDNLASVLGRLNQRGLSSSNLTANLAMGNQRDKQKALTELEEGLLGQRLGMQQGIGLQGLGVSAGEREQLAGIQGQLLGSVAPSTLLPNPFNWFS